MKPTEAPDRQWLNAERKRGEYPKSTTRAGKWLIFVHVDKVDEAWEKVRLATEKGQLGDKSKVSCGRNPNPVFMDPDSRVISVHTYDWKDKKDAMRVREKLRELGFKELLSYKTDADTKAGRYAENAGPSVNKYFV